MRSTIRDLPFLSFFVVGVWTLFRLLDRPSVSRGLAHALVCAIATDIRIIGVLLVPLTALGALAGGLSKQHRCRWVLGAVMLATCYVGAVLVFWPFLWQDPLRRFAQAFGVMAHYPWKGTVLFMGRTSAATELPWFYVPVWVGITSPISVLVLALVGVVDALRRIAKGEGDRAQPAVVLAWLLVPLLAVWSLESVLYDGWRQMYFIYPAIVLLAVGGLRAAWPNHEQRTPARWSGLAGILLVGLFAADAVGTACWMVRWHPYQNVYFNRLAGPRISIPDRFEVDYWGLSTRRLLEYVVACDPRPRIAIAGPDWGAQVLAYEDRQRLQFVTNPSEASYLVTMYRYNRAAPRGDEVFSVWIDGMRVSSVYELNHGRGNGGCCRSAAVTQPATQ